MDFFSRRLFSLTLILLAAVLAWWLSRGTEDLLYSPKPLLLHEPDYFLEDFTLTLAGTDGVPQYRLSGLTLTHYPDSNSAILEQPLVEIMDLEGGQWIVKAQQGEIEGNGSFVRLQGQVSLYRENDNAAADLGLTTDSLDIYISEGYAVTDEEVTIKQSSSVTRAKGLRINFQQRHLYLKSRVRGEYVLSTN